jgi:surface antigen
MTSCLIPVHDRAVSPAAVGDTTIEKEEKMMRVPARRLVAGVMLMAVATAGCQPSGGDTEFGPKTGIGAALGAAGGGLLGAATHSGGVGIAAGVLLGGLLGGAIGSQLDDQDRRTAALTTQRALESAPSGQTTAWQNPDTGHAGTVTPIRTYQQPSGQYCREFEQTVTIDGKRQQGYGTACRQPDGSWRIVG